MNNNTENDGVDQETLELEHRHEKAHFELESAKELADINTVQIRAIAGYTKDRDLINQIMGQVEMSRAVSKLTSVMSLTKLAHIKENKLYQTLKGESGVDRRGEKIPNVGTWDGFCRSIGSTASKVDEDLMNLKVLGEDALENLQRIGAGYRDLRQLRKLSPEDQAKAISEAEATGDKDALIDIIDELSAKHAKEKEGLERKLNKADRKLENEQKELEQRKDELAELQDQIAGLTAESLPLDEDEEAALQYVLKLHNQARSALSVMNYEVEMGNLSQCSLPVKMACMSFAEYLEKAGIALNNRIRLANPDIWNLDAPTENEAAESTEAEIAAREKLESQLPTNPLS